MDLILSFISLTNIYTSRCRQYDTSHIYYLSTIQVYRQLLRVYEARHMYKYVYLIEQIFCRSVFDDAAAVSGEGF